MAADHDPIDVPEQLPAAPGDGAAREPKAGSLSELRSHLLVGLLLALLGFAIVLQVRVSRGDDLTSLRQDDLVRLLDEVTSRSEALAAVREELLAQRDALLTSEDSRRIAEEAARERAVVQGILAGTLPVAGEGITVSVGDDFGLVRAQTLTNVLQELRNAGAEAMAVSGNRLTASSWFAETATGLLVDGVVLEPPYEWTAIGDSQTLAVALGIPGGALAAIRNDGGDPVLTEHVNVEITSVRELGEPQYATPAPVPEAG